MFHVYMLRCTQKDGTRSLYTGFTNSLDRRLEEHESGRGARYTRGKHLDLVFYQSFEDRADAMRRELEIKKLPASKKKKLISDIFVNEFLLED